MAVNAQKRAAAHRHHLSGNQLFTLIARPLAVAKTNRHIRRVAQIVTMVGIHHVNLGLRVGAHKRRQARDKPPHTKKRDQADGDLTRLRLLRQVLRRLAQHVKRRTDRAVIFPPVLAQHQPAPLTLRQRHLQVPFEHPELMADGRRRNVQLLRGQRDAAQPGNGLKGTHSPKRRIVCKATFCIRRQANQLFCFIHMLISLGFSPKNRSSLYLYKS